MATRLKTIMFTDRVGSSNSRDDNMRLEVGQLLEGFTRDVAVENRGAVIKFLGDGHLLTFDATVDAVRAGLRLQQKVDEHNAGSEKKAVFRIRVGIDVGDVEVGGDGDVIGHHVDMAKRVEDAGRGLKSPVLFTERVRSLLPADAVTHRHVKTLKLKGAREQTALYQALRYEFHRRSARKNLSAHLTDGFMQVLIKRFGLCRDQGGVQLQVAIERSLDVVTSSFEKEALFEECCGRKYGRDRLASDLKEFYADKGRHAQMVQCGRWPLRYANGGALPIIRLADADYVCLFYRDIAPIGWNIANGSSDSYVELYDPGRIVDREFGEELIIADHAKKRLLFYYPGIQNIGPGYQTAAVASLDKQFRAHRFGAYTRERLKVKWIKGHDSVRTLVENDESVKRGYFLSVTPEDHAIEVDRVAIIEAKKNGLPADARSFLKNCAVLDGELGYGRAIARIVGLFELDSLTKEAVDGTDFRPSFHFHGCEACKPEDFEETIRKAMRVVRPYRRADQRERYEQSTAKFDLCPIARAIIKRFAQWRGRGAVKSKRRSSSG